METYSSIRYFYYGIDNALKSVTRKLSGDDIINGHPQGKLDGLEFLRLVKAGELTSDSLLLYTLVDGVFSNLGLLYGDFVFGSFLVESKVWELLCNKYTIEVCWSRI